MRLPTFSEDARSTDVTTAFGGYNHTLNTQEGEFYDMKNMTTENYPILSPRHKRAICRSFTNLQGILDKDDLIWVDNGYLFINGVQTNLPTGRLNPSGQKVIQKMGGIIVFMPDKVWYNVAKRTGGRLDAYAESNAVTILINLGDKMNYPDYHTSAYYETTTPQDGDYKMDLTKTNASAYSDGQGEPSDLYRYSSSAKAWIPVTDTNLSFTLQNSGLITSGDFKEGDGVKLIWNGSGTWGSNVNFSNILFPYTDETTGERYNYGSLKYVSPRMTSFVIDVGVTFPISFLTGTNIRIERITPSMSFITEHNNRLWGCSPDGHEIYASKLGDVTNWQCFQGIATDSWSATVGSDGVFTGAITYRGYPMFFKEHSVLKVSPSATGAHQYVETVLDGVQNGSARSLAEVGGVLVYKGVDAIYAMTTGYPQSISDPLGNIRYHDGHAGVLGDRYYICLTDDENVHTTFVYDMKTQMWAKEDNEPKTLFCRNKDELYFFDVTDGALESITGKPLYLSNGETKLSDEEDFEWYVESGNIGFTDPNNKTIIRMAIRLFLEYGSNVSVYIQYDSDEEWKYLFGMAGQGLKTYTVPIKPRRCDHFRLKIAGSGDAKIYSLAKTLIQGSDVNAHNY